MKVSSGDVMSCNVLRRWVLRQQKGWDKGKWVGVVEGCRQHGYLWAQLENHHGWLWVGHCCPPMRERVKTTVLSLCTAPISSGEAFFPVWVSGCQLSTVTIASSLMGESGHERVEDGCKSTCVKFGDCKPDRTGDMASLMHV